jgi:hypothetical protein
MRLQATPYKFIIADANDVVIRTEDNVVPPSAYDANVDIEGVAGEALSARDVVYLSEGLGGKTAGRWYKADASVTYASSEAGLMGVVPLDVAASAAGAVRLQGRLDGYAALTPGSRYYVSASTPGGITASAPTHERLIGASDLSTSLVIQATYAAVKDATARTLAASAAQKALAMAIVYGR